MTTFKTGELVMCYRQLLTIGLCFVISCFTLPTLAEWDVDKYEFDDGTEVYYVLLNTDGDIDKTHLSIEIVGNRLEVFVDESIGGTVVDMDSERLRMDVGYMVIEGSDAVESIRVATDVLEEIRVQVDAYGGDDYVSGATEVRGGEGDDTLIECKSVRGGPGKDFIYDGVSVFGDEDNDTIYAGPNTQFVFGRDGDDTIDCSYAVDSVEVYGGDGDDTIRGSGFDDLLVGGPGGDDIFGRGGNDEIWGDGIRSTSHEGDGDDLLCGEAGEDTIVGAGGNDVISGGDKNDDLQGNGGIDVIVGGSGRDVLAPGGYEGAEWVFGQSGGDQFKLIMPRYFYHQDYSWYSGDSIE